MSHSEWIRWSFKEPQEATTTGVPNRGATSVENPRRCAEHRLVPWVFRKDIKTLYFLHFIKNNKTLLAMKLTGLKVSTGFPWRGGWWLSE